jgi:NAD+ diphosphatase
MSRDTPTAPHFYAGQYLDRASDRRKDAAWLAQLLADPQTRFVPVWQHKSLIASGSPATAVLLDSRVGDPAGEPILLGEFHGQMVFALELSAPPLSAAGEFLDLRAAGAMLNADEAGLLAYARAMVYWHGRYRFCGVCGSPTRSAEGGHVRVCSNPACGTETFPRLDPAIIVLVEDDGRALLGRQASWPAGRFSTIAGFVEPGESLEDAVAREVLEETSVRLRQVRYHSSQPWPFPSSLMVGFEATAEPGSVPRAGAELEDVRWFSREQIAHGEPKLPPAQSISYRLIEAWYDRDAPRPLAALLERRPAARR